MKQTLAVLAMLGVTSQATYSFTNDLASCVEFSQLFDNTCPEGTVGNLAFDEVDSDTYSCPADKVGVCAGTVENGVCTWERVLCVSCYEQNDEVYIRVNSNSLPGRCYYAFESRVQDLSPWSLDISYTARWNWDVSEVPEADRNTAADSEELSNLICESTEFRFKNLPDQADASDDGDIFNTRSHIGVALDGVLMTAGIGKEDFDPLYPVTYGDRVVTDDKSMKRYDVCGAHVNTLHYYHYHVPSPCAIDHSIIESLDDFSCRGNSDCDADPLWYNLNKFESGIVPLGISKDGHIVWSPKKSDGSFFTPCEVDICNGFYMDGTYGYASTPHSPYQPSCYGPAANPAVGAKVLCSENGEACTDSDAINLIHTSDD